jgi:5-(carboxyamino)imidazole ribonucleotide synthase
MAGEAASALGLSMAVMAAQADDAACGVAAEVVVGSPFVEDDLRAFAKRCDVVTFDHEQVDLDALRTLIAEGVVARPGPDALEMAVDKAHMRTALARADVPVPAFVVVDRDGAEAEALAAFGATRGWLVVEEMVPLDAELAVMVARRPAGEALAWPAVETAQVGGVCREVLVPGRLPASVLAEASELGRRVADIAGSVGVMAVELFWSAGRLLVNECGRSSTCRWDRPPSSTPRWPASTSSAVPTAPTPPSGSAVAWGSRAPMSTCMASAPGQDANWDT